MVRKSTPEPHRANKVFQSIEEIDRALKKLRRRVAELEELDKNFDSTRVDAVRDSMVESLRDIYGETSANFEKYEHYMMWDGPLFVNQSREQIQNGEKAGIKCAILDLKAHMSRLEEKKEDFEEEAPAMSNFHHTLVTQKMSHFSDCRFIDKKNRWEATVNGVKNIGYGETKEAAISMLRKIVENQVRDRPELENLEEHEAYAQQMERVTAPKSVTNVFHNVQGIINTGSISRMEHISVSVRQSIDNLKQSNEKLSSQLSEFISVVEKSEELPESTKEEILDRTDVITVEAIKAPEKRLTHRITDNIKGISDVLKGCAAAKSAWDVIEQPVKSFFGF